MNHTPENNDIIFGRNPVREALLSGREIDSLLVARGERQGSVRVIIEMCREKGVPVRDVAPIKLDSLCPGGSHQGVAAYVAAHEYSSVDDIFALAASRGEPPLIVLCDGLSDPHNLGAVIRTCDAAGDHGVIIPKRRAAGLTWAVDKASAGALEYVPVARVTNLTSCISELKEKGVWVCAADMDGQPMVKSDMTGPLAIVIGGEDGGISRLVRESCDFAVAIPMRGRINSLNASCACAVMLYEAIRQRSS